MTSSITAGLSQWTAELNEIGRIEGGRGGIFMQATARAANLGALITAPLDTIHHFALGAFKALGTLVVATGNFIATEVFERKGLEPSYFSLIEAKKHLIEVIRHIALFLFGQFVSARSPETMFSNFFPKDAGLLKEKKQADEARLATEAAESRFNAKMHVVLQTEKARAQAKLEVQIAKDESESERAEAKLLAYSLEEIGRREAIEKFEGTFAAGKAAQIRVLEALEAEREAAKAAEQKTTKIEAERAAKPGFGRRLTNFLINNFKSEVDTLA